MTRPRSVTNHWFTVEFDDKNAFQELELELSDSNYLTSDEWVGIALPYDDYRHHFDVAFANAATEQCTVYTTQTERGTERSTKCEYGEYITYPSSSSAVGPGTFGGSHSLRDVRLRARDECATKDVRICDGRVVAWSNETDPTLRRAFKDASLNVVLGPDAAGGWQASRFGQVEAKECPVSGCWEADLEAELGDAMLWSDPASWPSGSGTASGAVPAEGEHILIKDTMHILLDVDPPCVGELRIEGKLEFWRGSPRTLCAQSITVYGILEVGTETQPFEQDVRILLHGGEDDPVQVMAEGLFLHNKVLAA